MSRRRSPLHTCGVSISAIAFKAYTKTRDSNGAIGSMTKRMTKFAIFTFPLIHALQSLWLALLSFADDHILFVEKTIEKLFPPSTRLFDKIDEFVQIAETVPEKFDEAVAKFPNLIHQVPFLDLALTFLISLLKFLISRLTHWGSNNTKEREIQVDINCNNLNIEGEPADQAYLYLESPSHISISASSPNEPEMICQEHYPIDSTNGNQCENVERLCPVSDSSENDAKTFNKSFKSVVMKCSYKEMLEKGKTEKAEKEEESFKEDSPEAITDEKEAVEKCKKDDRGSNESIGRENTEKEEESFKEDSPEAITDEKEAVEKGKKDETGSSESIGRVHPILELFEASWHMKPGKGGK